jgi:hypothetical protein
MLLNFICAKDANNLNFIPTYVATNPNQLCWYNLILSTAMIYKNYQFNRASIKYPHSISVITILLIKCWKDSVEDWITSWTFNGL